MHLFGRSIQVERSSPWYSDELKDSAVIRDAAMETATRTNNDQDWADYRILRNSFNRLVKATKENYYKLKYDEFR